MPHGMKKSLQYDGGLLGLVVNSVLDYEMNVFYVAAFPSPSNDRWFSPGRQRKTKQVMEILECIGFQIKPLDIAPGKYGLESVDQLSLCYSDLLPVRFAEILIRSIRAFSGLSDCQGSILWLYNSRAAEAIVALVGLFLRPRLKLILQMEDLPSARIQNSGLSGLIDHLATVFLCRLSSHIFAVSPPVANALSCIARIDQSQIEILPPALDSDLLSILSQRREPFSQPKIRIVYAGSYDIDKGVTDLLKAFDLVDHPGYELRLIGSAPQKLKSAYSTHDSIVFMGRLSDVDLFREYAHADILVNPHRPVLNSDYIFPFKLIEYLASGVLLLTTRVPGYEAFDLPDYCVFTGPQELAAKLLRSRQSWLLCRERLGAIAHKCRQDYSITNIRAIVEASIDINPVSSR